MKRATPSPTKTATVARERRQAELARAGPPVADCSRCGAAVPANGARLRIVGGTLGQFWPTALLCPKCGEMLTRFLGNQPISGPRPAEKGHRS
jgi:hypothetical protein